MSLLEDRLLFDSGIGIASPPAIAHDDEARRSGFAGSPAAGIDLAGPRARGSANLRASVTDLGLVLAIVSALAAVVAFSGMAASTPGLVSAVFAVAVAGVLVLCSLRIAGVC